MRLVPLLNLLSLALLAWGGSACSFEDRFRPQGNGEGLMGRLATYEETYIGCSYSHEGKNRYVGRCAAYVRENGVEVLATALAPGVAIRWQQPTLPGGAAFVAKSCVNEVLEQRCTLDLAPFQATTLLFAAEIGEASTSRIRTAAATVDLEASGRCGAFAQGAVNVTYAPNSPHSSLGVAAAPAQCQNMAVITSSTTTELTCTDVGGGPASPSCYNNPAKSQSPILSRFSDPGTGSLEFYLSTEDFVVAGGPYSVEYKLACNATAEPYCLSEVTSSKRKFLGKVAVNISPGATSSSSASVTLPQGCRNPTFRTQTHMDSVNCGTTSGITICPGAPHTNGRDLRVGTLVDTFGNPTFSLNAGGDSLWADPAVPYWISYEISCDN